ncbi:MAG: hypothetical protein VX223_10135 [Myxococcota bacterium]|nr:hypothetical protein [Myxococcota bacterium]
MPTSSCDCSHAERACASDATDPFMSNQLPCSIAKVTFQSIITQECTIFAASLAATSTTGNSQAFQSITACSFQHVPSHIV